MSTEDCIFCNQPSNSFNFCSDRNCVKKYTIFGKLVQQIGGKRKGEELEGVNKKPRNATKNENYMKRTTKMLFKSEKQYTTASANLMLDLLTLPPRTNTFIPIMSGRIQITANFFYELIFKFNDGGLEYIKYIKKTLLNAKNKYTKLTPDTYKTMDGIIGDIDDCIEFIKENKNLKSTIMDRIKFFLNLQGLTEDKFNKLLITSLIPKIILTLFDTNNPTTLRFICATLFPGINKNPKFECKIVLQTWNSETLRNIYIPGIEIIANILNYFRINNYNFPKENKTSLYQLSPSVCNDLRFIYEAWREVYDNTSVGNTNPLIIGVLLLQLVIPESLLYQIPRESKYKLQKSLNRALLQSKNTIFDYFIPIKYLLLIIAPGILPIFSYNTYITKGESMKINKAEMLFLATELSNHWSQNLKLKYFNVENIENIKNLKEDFKKNLAAIKTLENHHSQKKKAESLLMKFIYYVVTNKTEDFDLLIDYTTEQEEDIYNKISNLENFLEIAKITNETINNNHKMFLREYKDALVKIDDLVCHRDSPPNSTRIDAFTSLKWFLYLTVRF